MGAGVGAIAAFGVDGREAIDRGPGRRATTKRKVKENVGGGEGGYGESAQEKPSRRFHLNDYLL